jgi:hypothetical protein
MDHRRNAACCGRPSLAITTGDLSSSSSEYVRHHYDNPSGRDGRGINLSRMGEQESPREWYYKIPHTRHGRDVTVTDNNNRMNTINVLNGLPLGSRSCGTARATLFTVTSAPTRIRRRDSLALGEAIPLWFAVLSPLIGLIIGFLGAWLFSSLTS